ncbi:MAG: hypothetical protein PHX49_03465 [Bacteroidales bacterium]|nr:hypothetical protein [Bacteroidales bacterium]
MKKKFYIKLASLFIGTFFLMPSNTYSQDGSLDLSFGVNGKVITKFESLYDGIGSLAIQSDGKIVVVGNSANDGNPNFAIIRLKDDGNADNSFSYDGIDTISVGGVIDYGRSVVVQSDEKIILAGYSHNGTDNDFALVRYNTNGTLDSSFGKDGIVTTAIGSSNDQISSMILQQDGRIVVAGNSYYNRSYDFALARYNIDGTLDTSFDSDGKQVTGFGNNSDFASSVALQSDGKIVVAGTTQEGFNSDFALARYNNTILTGVDEIQAEVLSVEIYADPTTDKLLVKAGLELVGSSYSVIDQLGRPIISGRLISESSSVAIDKLASGLNFFQVVGGNQMTVKFMKK